jgi:FkbM family methyltransferase
MRTIYDLGSNNGDDIPYYLMRGDKVIAVEANPALAEDIKARFRAEIDEGRLVVENCALTVDPSQNSVSFFVHRNNHVLSQFVTPNDADLGEFDEIKIGSLNVLELIQRHGDPFYIKIDIEHYDHVVLRCLFDAGIFPPYLSAESHSVEVFALLVANGRYKSFKLVEGWSVPKRYKARALRVGEETLLYDFPIHSAGPFGNDIDGPWMTAESVLKILGINGLGWIDIHVSNVDLPDIDYKPLVDVEMRCGF